MPPDAIRRNPGILEIADGFSASDVAGFGKSGGILEGDGLERFLADRLPRTSSELRVPLRAVAVEERADPTPYGAASSDDM